MMPRIRTVKPELFKHEELFDAEIKYQLPLRIAFVALFSCCDRAGRFCWQPRHLKSEMLPYDEVDMNRVLEIFVECGFVVRYEHQGKLYGWIPSWSRHQRINKEAKSELPAPDGSTALALEKANKNNEIQDERQEDSVDVSHQSDVSRRSVSHHSQEYAGKGRERKGRERKGTERKGGEGNRSYVASVTRQSSTNEQPIIQVFEHWKTVMKHSNAILDRKRRVLIDKALQSGYGVQQLCQAITGCSVTPHNIGDNDRGQRYDGLHVILRDADQIDRFIHNCESPPHPLSEAERRTQANVQTLQGWMNKTLQSEASHANS